MTTPTKPLAASRINSLACSSCGILVSRDRRKRSSRAMARAARAELLRKRLFLLVYPAFQGPIPNIPNLKATVVAQRFHQVTCSQLHDDLLEAGAVLPRCQINRDRIKKRQLPATNKKPALEWLSGRSVADSQGLTGFF